MKLKTKLILGGIVTLFFFSMGLCSGYKLKKCPEITTNTVVVHDSIPYEIPNDIYHYSQIVKDTIIYKDSIQYKDVDTAQILKNYFATYKYERFFHDTSVNVYLTDYISENKSVDHVFKYKILRPQTVIKNEQIINNYSRYLYGGIGTTLNTSQLTLELLYGNQKFAIGAGYQPQTKDITLKVYGTIFKLK